MHAKIFFMQYGISAGAIVMQDEKLLLVHHVEQGKYDFWVPPGGRLEGEESITECAARETWEETNLVVKPGKVLYIQEFVQPNYHFVKFFLLCELMSGKISLANKPINEDFLTEARFFSKDDVKAMNIYPVVLKYEFWLDKANGFPKTHYLELEHIEE